MSLQYIWSQPGSRSYNPRKYHSDHPGNISNFRMKYELIADGKKKQNPGRTNDLPKKCKSRSFLYT